MIVERGRYDHSRMSAKWHKCLPHRALPDSDVTIWIDGSMEITSSTPEKIGVRLKFLKPWKATNEVTFVLAPTGSGTAVTWSMTGEHKGMAALFGKIVNMDKLVGKDFEKGLARLKSNAELSA